MAGRKTGPPEEEPLMTVKEVAGRLRVSEETVRRYLRSGRLKGMALGGRSAGYRIEASELRRFLDQSRGETIPPVGKEVMAAA
jgi:excisionase family DNA binding protein